MILLLLISVLIVISAFYDLVNKHRNILPAEIADSGFISDSVYVNNYLGWEFEIPRDYETISNELRDKISNEVSNGKFDAKGTIKLLGIKKKTNKSSALTSTLDIRGYFPEIENPEEWYVITKDLLEKQLKNSGTTIELTKNKIQIDSITFEIADISYKKGNDLVYHQKMIFKFLNEYILTISIGADNVSDFEILFDNLKKTKFKNKEKCGA
ncbi:MAG: hypothetical protein AB9846_14150 [Tenuifilaceae bacterium]